MKLLLVDDEPNLLYSLEKGLRTAGLEILTAGTAKAGIERVRVDEPDAVVCDVGLPDGSGLDAFQEMRDIDPRLPVIIMTAHTTAETAIEAMKRGAFDYLLKPFDLSELRATVEKALEVSRLSRVPTLFGEDPDDLDTTSDRVDRIVGTSPVMQEVYKEIGRIAPQDVNVLILGESGTGKELVARAIYQHSRRNEALFLAINCAAIPDTLLESELFGHEKGAFTGADRRRIGKFEQAGGGTIFLDEIGDMSPATQAKVLRLLQDGRFERVGGNETIQSDVRIIAATNRDLDEAIREKTFREDLYYRLNTFTIHLPPLRKRLDDLPLLVDHFLRHFSRELDRPAATISAETMILLREHQWPGNIRELQSAIKYSIVHAAGEIITPDCLPSNVLGGEAPPDTVDETAEAPAEESLPDVRELVRELLQDGQQNLNEIVHQAVDRVLFEEVLEHENGHQVNAAKTLGISRTTLRARLQSLGLSVSKTVREEE